MGGLIGGGGGRVLIGSSKQEPREDVLTGKIAGGGWLRPGGKLVVATEERLGYVPLLPVTGF